MAKVKPPLKKKKGAVNSKGVPPQETQASNNLSKLNNKEEVGLNFKVEGQFRKEYKSYATDNDLSMTELLKQSFEIFKSHNK